MNIIDKIKDYFSEEKICARQCASVIEAVHSGKSIFGPIILGEEDPYTFYFLEAKSRFWHDYAALYFFNKIAYQKAAKLLENESILKEK